MEQAEMRIKISLRISKFKKMFQNIVIKGKELCMVAISVCKYYVVTFFKDFLLI